MKRVDVALAGLAASVSLAGSAMALEPPIIANPDWLRKPSAEDIGKAYPREAMRAGVIGKARIGCTVSVRGALEQCAVLSESPSGWGFGAAAVAMTRYFSWRPKTVDGVPVGGASAVIPVDFGASSGEYGAVVVTAFGSDAAARAAPPVVTNPDWSQAVGPGAADLMGVYPGQARRKGLSGTAKIGCAVTVEGKLDQCVVLEETPPNQGFGQAALRLSPYFRFQPRLVDGVPTGGATVVIPIRFDLPQDSEPATHLLDAPVWASQATPAQIAAAFPRDRLGTTDEERVTLQCKVLAEGGLGRCTTTEDDPSFYAAAQSLAKYYRLVLAAHGKPPLDDTYVGLSILFKASSAAAR
jgi:TonB family protein